MLKVLLKTYWRCLIGIDRDDDKIIWKLINAHSCWHYLRVGGVSSNTRINKNCSADSDDDFRRDYRNVNQ